MNKDNINVTITEKELINVDFAEKEILNVIFNQVDRIGSFTKLQIAIQEILIYSEAPTKRSAILFETINTYVAGTLRVYFNGIRENHITETSTTSFTMPIDTVIGDEIVIDYVKDVA